MSVHIERKGMCELCMGFSPEVLPASGGGYEVFCKHQPCCDRIMNGIVNKIDGIYDEYKERVSKYNLEHAFDPS